MTGDAKSVTAALHGRWMGSYGTAPCPICQPEARADQNALTLADSPGGRLLLDCKKARCRFADVLRALRGRGIIEGAGGMPQADPAELARHQAEQRREAGKRATLVGFIGRAA